MGDPTEFFDLSTSANAPIESWSWNFGDENNAWDTSIVQNPIYVYSETGLYDVELMVIDTNGCIDTNSYEIEVFPIPTSIFSFETNYDNVQGQLIMINESINAIDYDWDFDDGYSSNEEEPIHAYTEDGTYLIELVSWNDFNCPDTSQVEYELLFKGLFIPNAFAPNNPNAGVKLFE